jgi:signal transduction histidine kinase
MKDRLVLRWRAVGLLLAVLVIVALPYVATRAGASQALQARDWVAHSAEMKSAIMEVAYLVRDSEAVGYRLLAVGEDGELSARLERDSRQLPGLLARLRGLTRDNADQQVLLGSLQTTIDGRLKMVRQAIDRYRAGDRAGATEAVRGMNEMFGLHDLIDQITANEDRLLSERQATAWQSAFNSRLVLDITAAAQLLLLVITVVMSERQIGRRLSAERRTAQAEQRSQQIVQAVREPIALLDGGLNTLLVNAAFRELYGLEGESQLNRPLAELGEGVWNDKALLQRLTDVIARDRELWDYEMTQRTMDGVDRHVVINALRVRQGGPDDEESHALLLTVSDVTVRALVEKQVNDLNRQLEGKVAQISDVNRELEAFSYSVSHDLRAPLRHIAGFAGKLETHLGDGLDDKARHYLDVIIGSSRRMAMLIDDLLVFSRLGRGALRLQAVDMQSLVEEARGVAEADAPDRRIEWKIAPLPIVVCDENMLRTVWQNLIGNAVKYTGKREVARIAIEVERTGAGDYLFSVADNGAGFDMQYAGKLFGVFQRLHRASEFPGNGIGLANVRRIVGRHGGRVWAEGVLDKGATFYFTLPASDLAQAQTPQGGT